MGHKWGSYGAKIETACLWMARKVLILLEVSLFASENGAEMGQNVVTKS